MKIRIILTNKIFSTVYLCVFFLCSILFSISCSKEKEQTEHIYPRVVMKSVSGITKGSATFHASFLQAGYGEVIDHGFVFGTSSPYLYIGIDESISLGPSSGKGSFTATIIDKLESRKNYYVCAYARNNDIIYYSSQVHFITLSNE